MNLWSEIGALLFARRKQEYLEELNNYRKSADIVWYKHLGDKHPDILFYLISVGEKGADDDAKTTGFFALLYKYGLLRLEFADRYHLTPAIIWGENTPYYDTEIKDTNNVFEYYFLQASENFKIDDVKQSKNVCFSNPSHILCITKSFSKSMYDYNNVDINKVAYLYKKYFRLNDKTSNYIADSIKGINIDDSTLGIHFRGVEWGELKGHPVPSQLRDYFEIIDIFLAENRYDNIFVATESQETLAAFIDRYKDHVKFYYDVSRTPAGSDKLVIFENKASSDTSRYRMGLEVLRDAYSLANCGGFIGGKSQVSYAARYIRRSFDKDFYDEIVLDKGIVNTGHDINDYAKRVLD